MTNPDNNPFVKEVEDIKKKNSHLDMEQVRKFQEVDRILRQIPPPPPPPPVKQPKLQRIPLKLFMR